MLKDHLGSTRVVLDETNTVVSNYDYMPFGNIMRSSVNTEISYQYTGQEYDTELSLHNFRARLYDSDLGMFYAMDPAGQNYSSFSYAGNNPVIRVDRDGKFWLPILIGAVVGGYAGGAIANDHGNPFKWNWDSDTWKGIGFGSLAGGFVGSGIAFGGAYGTAVGASASNSGIAALGGADVNDLWKYGLSGFATGYFGATGGFGLAGEGMFGRLSTQALSTSIRSVGNNIARGGGAFSSVMVGLGPINFRFGQGQKLLNFEDNLLGVISNSVGLLNTVAGGNIETDLESLSLRYNGGPVKSIINWASNGVNYAFTPIGNMFNTPPLLYTHEGAHVWQSRFFGKTWLSYLLNWGREKLIGGSGLTWEGAYDLNFFEVQARIIQRGGSWW